MVTRAVAAAIRVVVAIPEAAADIPEEAEATQAAVVAFPGEVAPVRVAAVAYPVGRVVIRAAALLVRRIELTIRTSSC